MSSTAGMRPTVVIDVVGLSGDLLGEHTPALVRLAARGGARPLHTVTPAVTCTVQSTFTTGLAPNGHGCVGNGWYFRELAEVMFWKQSNHLVAGEKIWDAARKRGPSFTCAKLFWWYNMHSTATYSVTPRPMYPADGRKLPDIYTNPPELREELNEALGTFPLFNFWGPTADIVSSQWIADASVRILKSRTPTLAMVYLPHLDYDLQRFGPRDPRIAAALRAVDGVCGQIIDQATELGYRVVALSEYAITEVRRPVHLNRALRDAGLLRVRLEQGRELLDAGASEAFAVADHQVAHVYVSDHAAVPRVKALLERLPGVERVLDQEGKRELRLDHARSGELFVIAEKDAWFTYYYWLDDRRAPDFARTVDIHRKPGYDPVELFLDPGLTHPKLAIGWKLLQKKLGFRYLMDVIPLQPELVKGSHGRVTDDPAHGPVLISSEAGLLPDRPIEATEVKGLVLRHLFDEQPVLSRAPGRETVARPA